MEADVTGVVARWSPYALMQNLSSSVPIRVMSDIILLNVATQKLWPGHAMGDVEINHEAYPVFIELDQTHPCCIVHCMRGQEDIGYILPHLNVNRKIRWIGWLLKQLCKVIHSSGNKRGWQQSEVKTREADL